MKFIKVKKIIVLMIAFLVNLLPSLKAEIMNWDAFLPCLDMAKIGRIEQAKSAARGDLYQLTYRALLDRINRLFEEIPEILRQPKRSSRPQMISPLQMIRKHLQKSDEQPFIVSAELEEDFLRFTIKVIGNYEVIINCLGGDHPYPLSKLMGAFDALSHTLPRYASMLLAFSEKKELEKYQTQLRDDSKVLLELAQNLTELSVVLNDIVLNPGDNRCSTETLMRLSQYKYVPEHVSRPPSAAAMDVETRSSAHGTDPVAQ